MASAGTSATTMAQYKHSVDFGQPYKGGNIDRHGMKRVVPMEVISLGLPRTGTSSLRAALFELGYFGVYHMTSVLEENQPDADIWAELLEQKLSGAKIGTSEFDQVLGHCMACTDNPVSAFPEDLVAAYPTAKVVLTVRDSPDAWYQSMYETIFGIVYLFYVPTWNPLILFIRRLAPKNRFDSMLWKLSEVENYSQFSTTGRKHYIEHNDKVRDIVPQGNLLEFNVKEGWKPLCDFLGKPVPKSPFPRVNDRAEFLKNSRFMRNAAVKVMFMKLGGVVAACSMLGFAARLIWKRT